MNKKTKISYIFIILFFIFSVSAFLVHFDFGVKIWNNFMMFAIEMIKIIPPAFVLIGLFDVWVKRETIEKNFGKSSGMIKYLWAILLAATTVGGTFMAFPILNALYHKGAHYSSLIAYVTMASLVRIPMTVIESSTLGIKFTLIRMGVSIPVVIIFSMFLGSYLEKSDYKLPDLK
ncbi:MAG: permease [Clostridiales bacterium]|nr:permease [Clostridiales bacterium]